jgi:hypothetical protein
MDTDQLIARLSGDVEPVRPLTAPWLRAAWWLAGTLVYLGLVTAVMTSPADLAASGGSVFLVQQTAAFVAASAAAVAAFTSVVPGYPRWSLHLAGVAAGLWIISLVAGALREPPAALAAALANSREWLCVAMMIGGGFVPAALIVSMLRQGVAMSPGLTAALAVLAAVGLAGIGACISHPHPSSVTTLVWHGGTLAVLLTLAAVAGRRYARRLGEPLPHSATRA